MDLFRLPRNIGEFEGKEMIVAIGRFGPYVRHNSQFFSLVKGVDDPYTITSERAIELIRVKRERDSNRIIKTFKEEPDLQVLNGRWGPYISYRKNNYRLPKGAVAADLSKDDCLNIIENSANKKSKKK